MAESTNVTVSATTAKATAAANGGEFAVRSYRATVHLWAAFRAAREARDIETRLTGIGKPSIELQAAATNAVMLSVAFMESMINETLQDIAHSEAGKLDPRLASRPRHRPP